jgi:hypothetical protein
MRKTAWLVAVVGMAAISVVRGTPLNRGYVDGDAKVVAHLDFDQFKTTQMGEWFLAEMHKPEAENKLAVMKAVFNFDPREDMRSLTFYGREREEGVLILDGKFDTERAITLLKAGEGYETQGYDGEVIHSWIDKKCAKQPWAAQAQAAGTQEAKRSFAVVLSTGNIVMGDKLDSVERAIDVIKGRRAALSPSCPVSALIPAGNVPFFMAAADLAGMPPRKAQSGTFDGLSAASMTVGEQGGNVSMEAKMEAKDETTATQIQAVVQGIVSMCILSQKNDPEKAAVFSKLTCEANGRSIRMAMNLPAADMKKFLETCKPAAPAAVPAP